MVCEDYCPSESNLDQCFVALLNDEIIGYANIKHGYPEDEVTRAYRKLPDNIYYINQVAITKKIQSKGLGTKFYAELFKIYEEKTLTAHARDINVPSVGLHIKNGFELAGIFDPGKDFHGVDDYISYFLQKGNVYPVKEECKEEFDIESKKITDALAAPKRKYIKLKM